MPPPAVDIQGVAHRYGEHQALRDVTLQVGPEALYGLLGPNGSGKTTLFRILSTLLPPTGGQAEIFGMDVTQHPDAVRDRIGVVFQEPALDETLTVRENLQFQGALYGLHGAALHTRIDALLHHLHVADRADDAVEDLSGGLRRRADLARGLLHRPDLLLLDEPTAGLDPAARRTFWNAVRRLRDAEGTTLLLATHLMDEAERCDRVGILSDGALVANGRPEALKADLGEETIWVATESPRLLRDHIEAQFGVATRIVGATLQVAPADPPTFLPALYDAVGDRIQSATLRRPTLEDVFMVHAGVAPGDDREHALARTAKPSD